MFKMGPNAQAGIELAQQGRKLEALAYLRRAVTSEPVTADVWLWLAHVTNDVQEYRNCVAQALRLQPDHATARRMQLDLDYQSHGMPPPVTGSHTVHQLDKRASGLRRWRRVLILINAILLVTICGWGSAQLLRRVSTEDLNNFIPLLEESKRLQFSVGAEDDLYNFQVDVPKSWSLADSGSPSWRAERDRLQEEFPSEDSSRNPWREMQTDLSAVSREPNTGAFSRPVIIVETDSEKVKADPVHPPLLALLAVERLPESASNTGCLALGQLAESQKQSAASSPDFIEADVRARSSDDCLYYLEFRDNTAQTRYLQIFVPVGAEQLAVWQVTIPASLYDDYENAIDTILNSLRASTEST